MSTLFKLSVLDRAEDDCFPFPTTSDSHDYVFRSVRKESGGDYDDLKPFEESVVLPQSVGMTDSAAVLQMLVLLIAVVAVPTGFFMFGMAFAGLDTSPDLGLLLMISGGLIWLATYLNLKTHFGGVPIELLTASSLKQMTVDLWSTVFFIYEQWRTW